jgi:hypothetical protein
MKGLYTPPFLRVGGERSCLETIEVIDPFFQSVRSVGEPGLGDIFDQN